MTAHAIISSEAQWQDSRCVTLAELCQTGQSLCYAGRAVPCIGYYRRRRRITTTIRKRWQLNEKYKNSVISHHTLTDTLPKRRDESNQNIGDNNKITVSTPILREQLLYTCISANFQHCRLSAHLSRVTTDLGTDSEPHPVHCRSNLCRSIFVDRHWSSSSSN